MSAKRLNLPAWSRASLVAATLFVLLGAQQRVPQPPDNYYGLDSWFAGEIVQIADGRGLLEIDMGAGHPDAREGSAERLVLGERNTWVEFRYAKGWMYFDEPESGEQLRFNLRDGRQRLKVGHMIEVGRFPEMRAGRRGVSGAVRLEGWVLVRVSPGPNLEPDGPAN